MRALAAILFLTIAGCASGPGGDYSAAYSDRMDQGFRRLGAADARGRCLSDRLSRDDEKIAEAAVAIVENSESRDDMRERVLGADEKIRQAFIRANFGCGF